jgi:2-polyprenyl-6-methoxyphenol hydroxylase-like FAD-dependent oxidoreductase
MTVTRTTVAIVGGGPAGLMLSHLLAVAGIDSVVVDHRTRPEIENTVRAGILEADSVRLLTDTGVSDRVLRQGIAHRGIHLRFAGESHLIDFQALMGESSWLYPQTDVFIDLADARARDGGDVRFGVSGTEAVDVASDQPGLRCTDASGQRHEIRCDYLAGDAAHTVPPTGAKGLNLALADVKVLAEVLEQAVRKGRPDALDPYGPRALARVWKAQHFSYWMTTMLHTLPGASDFDLRRQLGELESVATSGFGSAYLAEGYTGWPGR